MQDESSSTLPDQPPEKPLSPFSLVYWVIVPVRFYQIFISPLMGNCCRFEPSCSNYYIQAVKKYGVIRGSLKGIWRILRCNPWCQGGNDPP